MKLSAFDKSAAWLAIQPRTEKEVRDYLKKKEYSPSEIDDAVEKLLEYGYVDDTAYGAAFIRRSAAKGWGRGKIDRSLTEKGISRTHMEAAWEQLAEETEGEPEASYLFDEKKRALETAVKMTRQHLEEGKSLDEKFLARVGRHLAGRGYSADTVYFAVNKLRGLKR